MHVQRIDLFCENLVKLAGQVMCSMQNWPDAPSQLHANFSNQSCKDFLLFNVDPMPRLIGTTSGRDQMHFTLCGEKDIRIL